MAPRIKTTPRKRPRQARSTATVDAILEATARVLVKEGYDGLSTNRVAEQAGVSIGSLYQYFPSKEALVSELLEKYAEHFLALVTGMLGELADESPRNVTRAVVRAMVEIKRTSPKLARVLREQIPRVGRMNRYEDNLERIVDAVTSYLERHKKSLRVERVRDAAYLVVHAADAVTHMGVVQERYEPAALIEDVTDMVTRYLTVD